RPDRHRRRRRPGRGHRAQRPAQRAHHPDHRARPAHRLRHGRRRRHRGHLRAARHGHAHPLGRHRQRAEHRPGRDPDRGARLRHNQHRGRHALPARQPADQDGVTVRRKLTERLSQPGLRLGALPLGAKVSLAVVLVVAVAAVLAPLVATHDPLASGAPVQPPGGENWFDTDRQGRDIFSRVVHGARYSLVIGLGATLVALAAAAIFGSVAATAGKRVSELIMRVMDIVMSFPGIALAAVFVSVLGRSLPVLVLTIAFLYTPQLTRVVRANVLSAYGEDYVAATKVMGASTPWIVVKHVARNTVAPVMVFATVLVADAIIFEASLSFIQAGVPDPDPSWGNIIAAGRDLVMSGYWWATFFPGLAIMVTVLCLNVFSEGLTDAMVAPKPRGKGLSTRDEVAAPARAAAATHAPAPGTSLEEQLAQLREAELARDDRLVYDRDEVPLLEVRNLCIRFPERHGDVNIVDNVSFTVRPGETMALVGESGCGKSITGLTIMGLID